MSTSDRGRLLANGAGLLLGRSHVELPRGVKRWVDCSREKVLRAEESGYRSWRCAKRDRTRYVELLEAQEEVMALRHPRTQVMVKMKPLARLDDQKGATNDD